VHWKLLLAELRRMLDESLRVVSRGPKIYISLVCFRWNHRLLLLEPPSASAGTTVCFRPNRPPIE
jgi:hypothetical protein